MNRQLFYHLQQLEADNLNDIMSDYEYSLLQHLEEFHQVDTLNKVTSGLDLYSTYPEGLQIEVTSGVAYKNYKRTVMPTNQLIGTTTIPTSGTSTQIVRIDLLYIRYNRQSSSPQVKRFIDINGNIVEQTIYTRLLDYFELNYVEGIESIISPQPPDLPSDGLILAYIHLRKNTVAIFDHDTGNPNEGFFTDEAPR